MVTIIFESHCTTTDNEAHLSSGWNDVELSELGIKQCAELGKRYKNEHFDALFCSDLQRSYKTGELAFTGRGFTIIRDQRLRECDYGDLTQHSSDQVASEKPHRIDIPFSNGESYRQCANRMRDFLDDLRSNYQGKKVMIIGHRATQHGLEHWILSKPLEEVVSAPWKWQPGWKYELEKPISIAEHTQFANMVTRVAVEHEGKYLMVQEGKDHVYGLWAFPGGKVDVGEALTTSAIREIKEETGVEVELLGIIGAQYKLWDERPGFTFELEFIAKAIFIPEAFEFSEEILAVEWKTKEEILVLDKEGKLRNKGQGAIAHMLANKVVLPISTLIECSLL